MKKCMLLVVLLTIVLSGNAQQWEWARNDDFFKNVFINKILPDHKGNFFVLALNFRDKIKIAKININGEILWKDSLSQSSESRCNGITDSDGNLYLTGWFSSRLNIGNYTLKAKGEWYDIYFTKFSNDGKYIFAKQMGGKKVDYALGIDFKNDHIFIAGQYIDTAWFDNQIYVSKEVNFFIGKYTKNGDLIDLKTIKGEQSYQSDIENLSVNENEDCLFSGVMEGNFAFNDSTYFFHQLMLGFLDSGNNLQWNKKFDSWTMIKKISFGKLRNEAIILDGNGRYPWVAGLKKLDLLNGKIKFSYDWDGIGYNGYYEDFFENNENEIFISGYFNNGDYNMDNTDLNIQKFDRNLNKLWSLNIEFPGKQSLKAICDDGMGGVLISGQTDQDLRIGNSEIRISHGTAFLARLRDNSSLQVKKNSGSEMLIFPNPSNGIVKVKNDIFKDQSLRINVFNTLGEKVFATSQKYLDAINLDLRNFQGVYFMEIISSDHQKFVNKIILNK